MNSRAAMLCRLLFVSWAALFTIFSSPAASFAASSKEAAPSPAGKSAEAKPSPEDALGRGTPYGAVFGFLRAADKGDYELASRFLEGRQPLGEKQKLARDLQIVLNRGLKIGLEDVSKAPEGRLDDDLNVYMEKVGTSTYGSESLDIVLRRTTRPDAPAIWLFSAETLRGVTAAAEQFDLNWSEAIWPESFRDIHLLSYPLFRFINQLVAVMLAVGCAALLTRVLIALLRPLVAHGSPVHGADALAQIKSLLFLLIFAILIRTIANHAVTVAARIFFASAATVLMIVAATWLLVRVTKMRARLKILRLQQRGVPSGIAAVELVGWLLVCVYVIAGLFLILRSLGFEITAAIAGLGVGGIAVAFAAQKTLENLFGTLTIVTDKPIQVGEQCQAGTTEGAVESIGLRSTRIRTADRAVVTIPNGQLAAMTIGNLTHRDKFLFRHSFRLRYGTTADQLRQVLASVRNMMAEHSKLEPATVRTRLLRLGDASLELEASAYVLTLDAQVFLEVQEELLLSIMDIVEASGTSLASPAQGTVTSTAHSASSSSPPPTGRRTRSPA